MENNGNDTNTNMVTYPKKFTKCPNCGSENRVGQMAYEEEIKAGKIKENYATPLMLIQHPGIDQSATNTLIAPRQVPIVFGAIDVCYDCGTLYCFEIQVVQGMAQPMVNQQAMKNKMPGSQR
jgi:hypothetical protein